MMEKTHQSVMVYLNLSEIFGTSTFILGLRCQKLKKNKELSTETLEKILITMITTIFLVFIQNKHFYLQLIIKLADGLLKYRTMRLFLIFLFSVYLRENITLKFISAHLKSYYPNKPNVCYFFLKTVDSYLFVFTENC